MSWHAIPRRPVRIWPSRELTDRTPVLFYFLCTILVMAVFIRYSVMPLHSALTNSESIKRNNWLFLENKIASIGFAAFYHLATLTGSDFRGPDPLMLSCL